MSERDVLDIELVVAHGLVVAMALETPHGLHRRLLARIRILARHFALKHIIRVRHART